MRSDDLAESSRFPISRNPEKFLNGLVAAVVALVVAGASPLSAQNLPGLLVGSVRERTGAAVTDGTIRAFDAGRHLLGATMTDRSGTFALALPDGAAAASVDVSCRYCHTLRVPVADAGTPIVAIVERNGAIASPGIDEGDLRALPYGRASDVAAMLPYTLAEPGGGVSDRGLAGGHSLVIDNGVPLGDLPVAYGSGLSNFSNRSFAHVGAIDPLTIDPYTYAAPGGSISLEAAPQTSEAAADAGGSQDAVVMPRLGAASAGFGTSADARTTARRGDLGATTAATGGELSASVGAGTSATIDFPLANAAVDRSFGLEHVSYATASRRYITSFEIASADLTSGVSVAGASYGAQYDNGSFSLVHPGPVALGIIVQASLAQARAALSGDATSPSRLVRDALTIDASSNGRRGSFTAALGYASADQQAGGTGTAGAERFNAMLPTFSGNLILTSDLTLHAGYGEAIDTAESIIDRTTLSEATLRLDDGARVRAELGAYRGDDAAAAPASVTGVVSSLRWEVAPRIDVRAWTLLGTRSRTFIWTTYESAFGVRFDVIAHSEPAAVGPIAEALAYDAANATRHRANLLDIDALIPIGSSVDISIGRVERTTNDRVTIGLRLH